jgi:hypothetical protein
VKQRKMYLYRYFDASGALLYIGITFNPVVRDREHGLYSPWHKMAVSTLLEAYPDRNAAIKAEIIAIAKEKPAFNIHEGGTGTEGKITEKHTKIVSFRIGLAEIAALDKAAKRLRISRSEMLQRMFKSLKT